MTDLRQQGAELRAGVGGVDHLLSVCLRVSMYFACFVCFF